MELPPEGTNPGASAPHPTWYGPPQAGDPTDQLQAAPAEADPVLVTMGDITCTQHWVVTPAGTRPIGDVTWQFNDMSQTTESIATWAIIVVILCFWTILMLLLLLIKERKTTGHVQVTVQGDRFVHTVTVPVRSPSQVADFASRVNYARSLSVAAGAPR
ncbi:MAG: hypothetical protein ACRD29_02475 [Acidimicrobiales bacterium]